MDGMTTKEKRTCNLLLYFYMHKLILLRWTNSTKAVTALHTIGHLNDML